MEELWIMGEKFATFGINTIQEKYVLFDEMNRQV